MLKYALRYVCVLFSFIQIINAAFELPDPTDGEACYIRLAAPIEFPADRIAAWDIHIHPLMTSLFVEAGREYSASLRNLCNAAFYFIEQGMGKVFEVDLAGNQARIREPLVPSLLKIEKNENPEQRLKAQARVLMRMVTAHPMRKK